MSTRATGFDVAFRSLGICVLIVDLRGRSKQSEGRAIPVAFGVVARCLRLTNAMTSTVVLAALLIGVIAGLRTFTAPAAVSWAASLGVLDLRTSWLAFMGSMITSCLFTLLVIVETIFDQLPSTASRKTALQFAGRIASGALCGAAVATARASWVIGLLAGTVGAIIGTLGGYDLRTRLSRALRRDRPAGFIEDAVAILGAVVVMEVLA